MLDRIPKHVVVDGYVYTMTGLSNGVSDKYPVAFLPPDAENPVPAGRHCGEDCRGCKAASIWAQGFAAGRAAASPETRDGKSMDWIRGEAVGYVNGVADEAARAKREAAASPDERLREALREISHVKFASTEDMQAFARSALAAADREAPNEPRGQKITHGLREAVRAALNELGVPGEGYPAPVANAVDILTAALAAADREAPDRLVWSREEARFVPAPPVCDDPKEKP